VLVVAHAGTGELSVIDRPGLHEKLARVAAGQRVTPASVAAGDVPSDLGFLEGLRRRIKLPGKGPRGVVLVGPAAWAAEYFTDSLGVVDIAPGLRTEARSVRLGPDKPVTPARMGERCFNDADLCLQQWQSCASCHPDARADGLNWDLINDGLGNPKNAKSMLLAHRTPPTMISGVRATAELAVRAGIRLIQFARRPEAEAAAIDEYLKSLRPVPSPHLVAGQLSESARRGQAVFESAGCSNCHAGELATDLKSYDVGTGPDQLGNKDFDTPTLVEVWRTAPYLYDGRAATILDVLTRFNKNDQHGATSKLTKQQLADLAEYVLSR
jgi:cytochrome c peroxidase